MSLKTIRAEFARRAVQFHKDEPLEKINLWGLFSWGAVSKYIKSGKVILNQGFAKENKTVWCRPSQKEIDKYIKPMIKEYGLEELTRMAGW